MPTSNATMRYARRRGPGRPNVDEAPRQDQSSCPVPVLSPASLSSFFFSTSSTAADLAGSKTAENASPIASVTPATLPLLRTDAFAAVTAHGSATTKKMAAIVATSHFMPSPANLATEKLGGGCAKHNGALIAQPFPKRFRSMPPVLLHESLGTPDLFRGPPGGKVATRGFAAPWMPEQVRHDDRVAFCKDLSFAGTPSWPIDRGRLES